MSASFARFLRTQRAKPAPAGAIAPRRPVHLIQGDAPLARACAAIRRFPIVGLDVETSFSGVLSTVQVATHAATAVIDVLSLTGLDPLRPILEDPRVTKIIHCAGVERGALGRRGLGLCNIFDTHVASKRRRGGRPAGGHRLDAVARRELGIVLDKRPRFSDWMRRPLTREQIQYAALDAEILVDLHHVFHGDGY